MTCDGEDWWKARIGFDDPGIPVLPEYLVKKVEDIDRRQGAGSTSQQQQGRGRSGRELWCWLRPRLRLLQEMTSAWGDVHSLYESR